MMKLSGRVVESTILLLFVVAMLFTGWATLMDHEISHTYPYGYGSSDSFIHYNLAETAKQFGKLQYFAPWYVWGHDDVEICQSPLMYDTSGMFSFISGIETYDLNMAFAMLAPILISLIMYLLIRKLNKNVALLSLPLGLLSYTQPFSFIFSFGALPHALSWVYAIGAVWAGVNIRVKYVWVLLYVFMTASFMTHSPEMLIVSFLVLLIMVVELFKEKDKIAYVKPYIYAGVMFVVLNSFELIRFFGMNMMRFESVAATRVKHEFGIPFPVITDFPVYILVILGIGVLLSVWLLTKKQHPAAIITSLFFLVAGYGNYFHLDKRAIHIRMLWPVLLSIFFGIVVYMIIKSLSKKRAMYQTAAIALIVLFSVQFAPASPLHGFMTEDRYEGFVWLRENTPEDAIVHYMYCDECSQTNMLGIGHRESFVVRAEDIISTVQNGSIKREYLFSPASEGCSVGKPHRESLLSWKYGFYEHEEGALKGRYFKDICEADYVFFEKESQAEVLEKYNMYIAAVLLKNDFTELVYQNDRVAIIHNKKPGEKCIENGKIQ